jgi:hypothetical protein
LATVNPDITTYDHQDPPAGSNYYTVTAGYNSGESASADTVFVLFTGIPESRDQDIVISPNPSTGKVTIRSGMLISRITLLTTEGHVLREPDIPETYNISMDLGQYLPGMYIVKIETERGTAYRRIIIK